MSQSRLRTKFFLFKLQHKCYDQKTYKDRRKNLKIKIKANKNDNNNSNSKIKI